MKVEVTLDTYGLYCPVPVIKAKERIKEMKIGQVLEVLSDDPQVLKDMAMWCKNSGNRFLKFEKSEDEIKVYIEKGED